MAKRQTVTQQTTIDIFKLRPLPACIRMAVASGVLMGSVSPVQAELPIPSSTQAWASLGVATHQIIDNGSTLHIDQQSQNAILNWDKFNVGANNKVEFNQPNSSAVALNRILRDANPSQILGQVTANGQIYLYNPNGFVFGKDSTVNVNTLVASSLNISDETITNGLTKQSGLGIDKAALGDAATKANSKIRIEQGAKIQANGDANNDGLVIIAAPDVENKGTITTNEFGQVILVASQDKVYLQPTDQKSPFSGLLVEVDTGGKVSNLGDILVRQGNITLEGFAVNQGGRLTATTSVNVNGSIRLLAQEQHVNDGGRLYATKTVRNTEAADKLGTQSKITFDSGSLTQIIADNQTADTAIDTKVQAQSYMDMIADQIHIKSNAAIVAPYGNINAIATDDLSIIDRQSNAVVLPTTSNASKNAGRILVDKGATIDVSGTQHVQVAMERNVGKVSVQTFDLRDSPLQKDGVLKGQTIFVDTRQSTPIVDISGAKNSVERTVEERLAKGGQINLTSNGDVIVNSGAVVNISGGSIDFKDGYINTTKLLTDYGKIVDISDADPNEHYVSIFGVIKQEHKKWGVTEVWDNSSLFGQGRFEKGYSEGQSAGSINIQAPLLSWNATLIAGSTAGVSQRELADMPFGGSFILNETDGKDGRAYVSTQNVIFQAENNTVTLGADDKFPTQANGKAPASLVLSNALLNNSGIQKVVINTAGSVKIAKNAAIDNLGANISLNAGNIDVAGSIYAAGGTINLTTNGFGVDTKELGKLTLGESAKLDVSGRWINDLQLGFSAVPVEPLAINGGTVNLTAIGDLDIKSGSLIKADGGAHLSVNNNLTEGKGGNVNLAAVGFDFPSSLHLNGKLSAWGLSEGGSLSLTSAKITVGSAVSIPDANGISPLALNVSNGSFSKLAHSGFNKISLNSHDDSLTVTGKTHLRLLAQNRVLESDFSQQASARSLTALTHVETLPEHLRNPVDLTLTGLLGVTLKQGSQIIADTGASISLATSKGGIFVDGTIAAPAGSIDLTIKASGLPNYDPTQAIWLGSHASLLANGTTKMQPLDAINRRSGEVLDGGKVSLVAERGYVIQEKGSLIDVSGTHAILDLPVANAKSSDIHFQPKDVGSNAGSIIVKAGEGIVLEGEANGHAGSKTTQNGRFDLTLNPGLRGIPSDLEPVFPGIEKVIKLTQHTGSVLADKFHYGDRLDKFSPGIPLGKNSLNGTARVSSDYIEKGDFGDVRLSSPFEIRFVGHVELNAKSRIELNTQKIGWEAEKGVEGDIVKLNTAYLKAGTDEILNNTKFNDKLGTGAGKFTGNARWTELVGPTRWDGFKQINLKSEHDLRVRGVWNLDQKKYLGGLKTAANLNLAASQIYPSTLTEFTFSVDKTLNPKGKINISGKNNDETPLSANGVLSFDAPTINQNGVLKAPFGTINLNASSKLKLGGKSLTSVSADGKTIPFGITEGGLFWLYPLFDGTNLVFNTTSQNFRPIQSKQVNLTAPEVTLAQGSKIDISGGGDLKAYEFISGAGGTYDYLSPSSPSYQGGFAIVPSLGSALAPFDPMQQLELAKLSADQLAGYGVGSQIHLSGAGELPAGTYTILPARYALLPGAFLVTPQANTQDQTVTTFNAAGLPIVSGYQTLAGTGTRSARTSGFLVESGKDIRKHSEYDEQTANSFFVAKATANDASIPLIPKDSGQIAIDVANKLLIEGTINSTPATDANGPGRGGKLDIASINGIKIVNGLSASQTPGTLEIQADNLNNLNLDSLFLGGIRRRDNATGETDITVNAANVEVAEGVGLKVKDLVIAAKDNISIKRGAVLTASGAVNTGDTSFKVAGYGALLRVSSDKQVSLSKDSTRQDQGELFFEEGAVINGLSIGTSTSTLASVLVDSSQTTRIDGDIRMTGGSLSLNANAINIGEVDNVNTNALNLTNRQLSNLLVDELLLNSRQMINFYGNVGKVGAGGGFLTQDGSIAPLQFGSLVVNSAGFSGFANQGKAVRLQANALVVGNSTGAAASAGTGGGQLDILTNDYVQGAGNFNFNGFKTVNINPIDDKTSQFHIDGKSLLTVASDLNLKTDYLTAAGGADMTINALGHKVVVDNAGHVDNTMASGFGASVNISADAVGFNTNALLYSGKLALHGATGDVAVGDQAAINLEGKAVKFADVFDYTPGGVFSAIADQGKIMLAAHSKINLSTGGGLAEGGKLILKAPKQTVDWSGEITAASGSAVVDMARFNPSSSFDAWIGLLSQAGVSQSVYFRSREADLVQGSDKEIKADSITLVADHGAIGLSGKLNADGAAEGGKIELYAGDKITLQNTGVLSAKGIKGGNVLMSSVDADEDGASGISIQSGASIDVTGSTVAQGGDVTLRALQDTKTVIKIDPVAANTVKGAQNYYAEAVKKYRNADIANGVVDNTVIAQIQADTFNYMSDGHIKAVKDAIDSHILLRPGIEIDYQGDLKVKDTWDFAQNDFLGLPQWRYGGKNDITGNLVISATGSLAIAASISDAYVEGVFGPALQGGNSWSYQLAAGADLGGADNFATINAVGHNLEIQGSANNPVSVRTGIGDIKLAAGGDVIFKNQYSTVYNSGRPSETNPYGSLENYLSSNDYIVLSNAQYAVDGGDLVIKADNNVQGAVSNQFITEWLVRVGDWGSNIPLNDPADSRTATAWGVDVGGFRQNVGSFGGGTVNVSAGGNINNLSVMMPSTGKQIGKVDHRIDPNTGLEVTNSNGSPKFLTNDVLVAGGGQMSVQAGGNISGGAYLLGKGDGSLSADGQITGGKEFTNGPQLVMGDSTLALNAKQDISISAVSDAMVLSGERQFYTYTPTSGITVRSLSGDVNLGADTSVVRGKLALESSDYIRETSIYPASLRATAFGGSVVVDEINLFPSVSGKLSIFAKDGIKANANSINPSGFFMRDVDLRLIPDAFSPKLADFSEDGFITALTSRSTTPVDLLHKNDKDPVRLITQEGDIQDIQVLVSKKAIVQAGRDLSNVRLDIQNINPSDVTVLSAGRDISYKVQLDDIGFLAGVNNATAPYLQISGPGDVLVKTGRNLDLGVSKGLLTVGNELNTNLDSKGANITVLAGLNGKELGYSNFISKYLTDYPLDNNFNTVSGLVRDYVREKLGDSNLSTADALKVFEKFGDAQKSLADAVKSNSGDAIDAANSVINKLKARLGEGHYAAIEADYQGMQAKVAAMILPVYENHANLSYQGITNAQIVGFLKDSSSTKYNEMIGKYFQHFAVAEQFNDATTVVAGFMRERTGNAGLTDAQALALFKDLSDDDYLSIQQQLNNEVLPVYLNEIKESGAASAGDKTLGNDRAFAAINTLFPGSELKTDNPAFPWQGDVNLIFSTIQTVEGGNVNLLVPGGKVNAGLAFAFPGLEAKQSSDLGVIAQKSGDINAIVRDDFLVNQSRVFTQASGNISIWSTEGDIDAGRGAKTALSVPETVVTYTSSGKKSVIIPAVSGSGVRASAPQGNVSGEGDVFLFAPGGVVNAGEAGIGGSNVTISATAVLGANNIQIGGVSTGVPTASVGSLAAGLSGVSNLSASVSQIAQAATDTGEKERADRNNKPAKLGVLSVDFIGYGEETPNNNNKNKSRPAS